MFKKMIFVAILVFVTLDFTSASEVDGYDFLMPNVWPHKPELYLCTPIRISPENNYYIVGFEPNASMHTAHHMLLYGCTEPGSSEPVWNCGEMASNDIDDKYKLSSPCRTGSQIVYAWARDAPSLHLPSGVGFLIGKNSPIKYLVLQVHYMSAFEYGKTDRSGVSLKYTTTPQPRLAGVYLLGTGGSIPGKKVEHMESACVMEEPKTIHPFAYRVHTHSLGLIDFNVKLYKVLYDQMNEIRVASNRHLLVVKSISSEGKVVSGYVVTQKTDGSHKWRLLGKKNPQLPQMFYPIRDRSPIMQGNILAARCTMNNTKLQTVFIGPTNKDEMCNFYLMYWVENDTPMEGKYCFSTGPPIFSWREVSLTNIPDEEASSL